MLLCKEQKKHAALNCGKLEFLKVDLLAAKSHAILNKIKKLNLIGADYCLSGSRNSNFYMT